MATDELRKQHKKPELPILERKPPYNLEAEQGVLGSMLLNSEMCDEVALILRVDDFYDDANQRLFSHLMAMHDAGSKIDITLLVDRLQNSGDYEKIGGAAYLGKVAHSVANAAHAAYYARIVREKSTFRSLINAATEILRDGYDESREAKEALASAEQKIFSILDSRGGAAVSSIKDVLLEAMARMDARMKGEHTTGGVETGYHDLDAMTGGLHNAELVVLAARPSMGKTAFAMNIAENVVLRDRKPVLFISLEMSAIELADRLLCSAARVNGHRLRNGTISNDDRKRLVEKAAIISQAPLFVDDSPARTVTEIAAGARRIQRREGTLGLIIIDYLQLIEPDNSKDPRQEQVAKITRRLKGLSREMSVPVLCLAQLNRQAEAGKDDHRPKMSHLRESGAIEQDADVVMFVHREEYYKRGEDKEQFEGQAEIIISKQRNGPVGDVELIWRKDFTRFEDKTPERYDEFDTYNDANAGASAGF
ncbi:replicative DNA helicase [Lignipirellula cremea]|uniref:Replicative DNA helicase n=1 Tax=Lignipirellula cremea TaxID=2528010 RepID=A0A518E1Q3_9BACT|nr:replicative DNA helicase [Lignipirellula cremea]QDU98001.1 Replicative DNA helicase [Lignipirellula cremea]